MGGKSTNVEQGRMVGVQTGTHGQRRVGLPLR